MQNEGERRKREIEMRREKDISRRQRERGIETQKKPLNRDKPGETKKAIATKKMMKKQKKKK